MFSPYYAASGRGEPENHVSLNVALYGGGRTRWAMTERGRSSLSRGADWLRIGESALSWDGQSLSFNIRETAAPIPFPVRGRVKVTPMPRLAGGFFLDDPGRHLWAPIAPRAEVECSFDQPGLAWRGLGYCDSNFGRESLEAGFRDWRWGRAHTASGTRVFYEVQRRDGTTRSLALAFDRDGIVSETPPPQTAPLPRTVWGLRRAAWADPGAVARVRKTWEDSPFYARTAVASRLDGEEAHLVHEALALDRFRAPWVHALLPYRMPRRA